MNLSLYIRLLDSTITLSYNPAELHIVMDNIFGFSVIIMIDWRSWLKFKTLSSVTWHQINPDVNTGHFPHNYYLGKRWDYNPKKFNRSKKFG